MEKDQVIVKKTETLQLKIQPSLKKEIVDEARREGFSASAFIRTVVRGYIDRKRKKQ